MIKTTWSSIKTVKNTTGNTILYSIEKEYVSNDPNIADIDRYYIRIQDGIEDFFCFITIENPANADQQDFEANYKSNAIET